jgi:hypothetical protein
MRLTSQLHLEAISACDPAGRMHNDGMAKSGTLWIKRLLDAQRSKMSMLEIRAERRL